MNAHIDSRDFKALLECFVKGTSTTPWKVIVEQLHGPQLRRIQAAGDDREAAEECWQILCDDQFESQVLDFYTPSVPFAGEGDKKLAGRLIRNARALFATACAAAIARDGVGEDQHALLLEWYRRAVAVLDPDYAAAPPPIESTVASTTADDLIQWACETVGVSSPAAYCARVWSLWWQDRLVTSNQATKQTWLAWTSNNHADAGSLEVTETVIPFAALVEHPDVALIPAHEDWLNTIERAWNLSNCATLGRTVFWRVQLPNAGGLILKHTSAGGGFYVALSCLRDRRASDPSRAILAALPDDEAIAPQVVASVDQKIGALVRSNVKSFAVAEGQTWHPHSQVEIVECRSLDDSVEFMSGLATQLEAFAISIAETTPAQTETYIEPILFKTPALNITRVDRISEETSASAIDLDIGMSAWSALAPLLNGSTRRAVLVADSGFGKTALVEWMAGRLAKSSLDFFEQPKMTFESRPDPFVLPLKANHLLTAIVADRSSQSSQENTEFDDESARRLLVRAAVTRYRDHEQAISYVVDCASGARHNLEALIIVDGLDAVRAERRRLMLRFIAHISKWNCRILLTGREYAFDASQIEGATIYRIREFTLQQTRRYVEQSLGPERAQWLLRLFNSSRTSRLFARVPLLLSMICRGIADAEQNSKNALEAAARKFQFDYPTRTTLYRELFLDRLGQDDAMVLADQRLQVLADMSVKWLKESGADADVLERDVIAWIGTDRIRAIPIGASSSRIVVDGEVDPGVVATTLLENFVSVGILSPTKDRKSYRATHPSFNEYLAGRGLAVRINCRNTDAAAAAAAGDDVMLHLLDPSWRGVTPFVAGELDDPQQMLSKIQLDPDPFHLKLFTVVKWLAEIKPTSALEADVTKVTRRLIDLLGSRSLLDRDRAIEAVGEIGIGWHNIIAPLLTPLLNHSKPNLQAAALEAACLLSLPPAIERAREYVRSPSRKGRDRVLRRLAAVDPLAGVEAARELIDDRVLAVRATATDILLTYGDSVDTLIAQLRDTNSINRELASKALAASENSETANKIRALLHDEEEYVRVIAIKTLASLDAPWLMSAIGEMVTDASVDVRIETASALGRIGSAEALAKLQTMLADDVVAPKVLDGFSAANALPGLDADLLLNHPSPLVQLRAASLYHKHGVGNYLPRLLAEVSAGSEPFFALKQLSELKDPESTEPLIDLLTDSPPGIQSMIAEALGKIGARKAVRPLIDLTRAVDSINRVKAVEALGQIGDILAVATLIERLGDDNVFVRRAAVRALGALRHATAVGPLLDVITWNDDLTAEAAKALASFATLPQLLSSLRAAGGLLAVAQKSGGIVIYELLCSLVVATQPNLWADDGPVLGELTNSVARSQAAGSHVNKR